MLLSDILGTDENVIYSKMEEAVSYTHLDALNRMWRNGCLNDTYEPGSTFKIITSTAALESGSVSLNDRFYCPGYKIVEARRIRCHKIAGHGSESFVEGPVSYTHLDVYKRQGYIFSQAFL